MSHRPSTRILAITDTHSAVRSAQSLRARVLVISGIVAVLALAAVGYAGVTMLRRTMAGDEDARIVNAASLSKQLVDRVLAERSRQVDLIASAPSVIAAARKGGDVASQRGLAKLEMAQLEDM